MSRFARSAWKRLFLRSVGYADRHTDLEQLYRLRDPWDMDSAKEQFRFEKTNAFVESHLGRTGSVLEIGCGEGHQSAYLARICDRLIGIDVSERAVARAASRCPNAVFFSGDMYSANQVDSYAPFDLVTACEVLYYMKDVQSAMNRMFSIGNAVLVSYYDKQAASLDPVLDEYPEAERGSFEWEGTVWHLRLWTAK